MAMTAGSHGSEVEAVLDESIRGDLLELLGEASVSRLLGNLAGQLAERLDDEELDSTDRKQLASNAHAMVSAAGMLGFSRFSALCSELENACLDDLPLDQIRAEVKSARDRVLAEIASRPMSGRPASSPA